MSAPRQNSQWREPKASVVAATTLVASWPGERLLTLLSNAITNDVMTSAAQFASAALPFVLTSATTLFSWMIWNNRERIGELWRALKRPWAKDEALLLDTEVPETANEPLSPLPLPQSEVDRRILAIDTMYDVLNSNGMDVSARGRAIANSIREAPFNDGPRQTLANLELWKSSVEDLISRIRAVQRKFSIRDDVYPSSLAEFAFDTHVATAVTEMRTVLELLERMGPNAHPDCISLAESQIRAFQSATEVLERWVVEHLAELKNGYAAVRGRGVGETA